MVASVGASTTVERAAIHKVVTEDHKEVMASKQDMVARNEVTHPPPRDIEHDEEQSRA